MTCDRFTNFIQEAYCQLFFKKANMYALKDCKKKFGCGLKGEKKF